MKNGTFLILLIAGFLSAGAQAFGQETMLDSGWHHIRNSGEREWSEFPRNAEQSHLIVSFPSQTNVAEKTLSLRQYDVKLNWKIELNGELLGSLTTDEKDLLVYFRIPPGRLRAENRLAITCSDPQPDDIRVGEIRLLDNSLDSVLSQSQVFVEILDAESEEHLPSRLTITNGRGILQTVLPDTTSRLAVRPGYVYTANGRINFSVPSGTYTLFATRGFEYGVDSARIDVAEGASVSMKFFIRREVPTVGWAASDTHIHTFTWSRHGDASIDERAITIAGEAIELPVLTDHNLHADLKPSAIKNGVVPYFTPITGNEVTTPVGHFNIFPVVSGQPVIDHKAQDWETLGKRIKTSDAAQAVILNHARDVHMNFRPHDPTIYLSPAGMRLDGWTFFPNAMEVINSGSQQSDQLQLMRDWLGMLNHGNPVTPVGSSDSHDVSRFIVGQARTYIRCNDEDPANIDLQEALQNFVDGSVLVSFGLLTEIEINDAYGPGELVPGSDEVKISVKVWGPSWTHAEKVSLYVNGKKIREAAISNGGRAGEKWSGEWFLTVPSQDMYLVAVAEGPAQPVPYWPIAKPYQPVSPDWMPRIFGITGAVWVDGDRNRELNSARDYAETIVKQAGDDLNLLMQSLAPFDEAVAIQAAALLHQQGKDLAGPGITKALRNASPEINSAFRTVVGELSSRTTRR